MRLSPSDENHLRERAMAVGMPACDECVVRSGDFDDGGIWVGSEGGLVGRKKWIKGRWTVEVDSRRYSVGQDQDQRVIAYAPADESRGFSVWRSTSIAIRYTMLAVVTAVWTVVGFIFWLPLLVRGTVGFLVNAVYANLAAPDADVPNRALQHAALFYVNGFRSIYRAVLEPHSGDPERTPTFRSGRFLTEVIWAVLSWWVVLFVLAGSGEALGWSREELASPIGWFVDQVAMAWSWLIDMIDELILRARGMGNATPSTTGLEGAPGP